MALASEQHQENNPASNTITFRAILLGVLTVVAASWYMSYYATNMSKSYLPVAALVPFVMWVGVNACLNIFAPRFALKRIELLTIFSMMWIIGNLPAVGWGFYAVSLIPAPEFWASPENRLREAVIPFLPSWLFLDANMSDVRAVFTGRHRGDPVPWLLWARPFFWWFVGCISAVMAGFFCSVLFFKQWQEKERLVFPMSEFPVALLEGTDDGRVPTVFRDKIFWIGFWCVAGVIGWNIIGYFELSLPRITVFDAANTKAVDLGLYYPDYFLRVQPLIMGLAYLCPTDILFSMWFYNLINIFKVGMLNRTGFTVGLEGQPAKGGEIAMLEMHGALVCLVVWSVWVARKHLKETVQKALNHRRVVDDGEPVSYRTAWVGLGVATIGVGGWMVSSGIGFWAMFGQLILMFICYFGIAKYAAATGFTFLRPAGGKGLSFIHSVIGTSNLSPSSQSMLILFNRNVFLGDSSRTTVLAAIPHIFRMLGDSLRRHRWIWALIILAYFAGYASSGGFYMYRCYEEGGLNGLLRSWPMDALISRLPYIEGSKVTVFDTQKLGVWMFGFAEAGLLTYLRSQFAWWPFHPVAIAFPPGRYAFCILLVWIVKVIVLGFGGVKLYKRSLPFWYGAIVGYLFGIAVSSVIDAIWFPDGGHFVHGW